MTLPPSAPIQAIRFEDGEAYERGMGIWSRLAGTVFLDWLNPAPGQRWADIGCGNGAFTEVLSQRCGPVEIQAIDPSAQQLAFARSRPGVAGATFHQGDAMALPFGNAVFDAAVMALVIFFVPDPAKGLAEMVRVTRPGGLVAAYAWDIPGGGLPIEIIRAELRRIDVSSPLPPNADISRAEALHALWTSAGLKSVQTRPIAVQRTYETFEEFWTINLGVAGLGQTIGGLEAWQVEALKERVRALLPPDGNGRVTCHAQANAVRGWVPEP